MQRPPQLDDTTRRALALWAALLWVLGFELLPGMHIGMHGELPAHVHGVGHDHDHVADHEHDDADHDHREFADVDASSGAFAGDRDHGDHELLHRGIAALPPPLAIPPIHDAAFVQLERVRESRTQLGARVPTTVRARGPPAAPSCPSVDCTA
ncbi:MAG TPA: hypothetical protein VG755_36160 [Nannocystaceae bacterium]|nr:hypothetical protein [Nannocystaceae bacterium]